MTDTRMPAGQRAAASRLGATLVVNASTATTPFSAMPAATTTTPATQAIPIGDCPLVHLVFGLKAAVTKSFNYRVIGWHNLSVTRGVPLWVPKLLASGAATAASGSTAITGVATGFFADTITETLRNPGSIVTPETPDNSVAVLTLDTKNSLIVTIETDLADATHAYVWSIPGESSGGGMADITVTGLGLATSALQTAANLALSPPISTGLAAIATADAEWTSVTLTANAVFADVSLEGASAYMVCQTATPADADTGAIYQPNIVYRIPTRGRTKIWFRRTAATNATIHVTDYSST